MDALNDARDTAQRLKSLMLAGYLDPQRLLHQLERLDGSLNELEQLVRGERAEAPAFGLGAAGYAPLPKCRARFHGHLTVFDGGRA